jgi:hypothetical protein
MDASADVVRSQEQNGTREGVEPGSLAWAHQKIEEVKAGLRDDPVRTYSVEFTAAAEMLREHDPVQFNSLRRLLRDKQVRLGEFDRLIEHRRRERVDNKKRNRAVAAVRIARADDAVGGASRAVRGGVQVGRYLANAQGLFLLKSIGRGVPPIKLRLANFTARITTEIRRDDGVDATREFEIEARLGGQTLASGAEALTRGEAEGQYARVWSALIEVAHRQSDHQRKANPGDHFLTLLHSAIAAGRAHVAARNGAIPDDPGTRGWCSSRPARNRGRIEWLPQGTRVGWLDGPDLFLDIDSAYRAAQTMAADGNGIAVGVLNLVKRLHEDGWLKSVDERRGKLRVRRIIGGSRLEVLHLPADVLEHSIVGKPAQSAHLLWRQGGRLLSNERSWQRLREGPADMLRRPE